MAYFYGPGGGENLLRFCFSKKDAELAEACRRLRLAPAGTLDATATGKLP